MKTFIYPSTANSVNDLKNHCRFLSIQDPICWDYRMVRFRIENLIKSKDICSSFEIYAEKNNSLLSEFAKQSPMILFFGGSTPIIKELIRLYKQEGNWPIFAVITKSSLKMTLSCLLKHLIKDRKVEMMSKKRVLELHSSHKDL